MSRYKGNYRGLGQMLNAEFMVQAMHRRAEKGKAYAESIAPVYVPGPHPGRYKASFTTSAGKHGGNKHDRAYGRLENTSEEAFWVEWGNRNVPRHRVLGKSLEIMRRG